jgi:thiol-disulfide isomerase/thioredoxin
MMRKILDALRQRMIKKVTGANTALPQQLEALHAEARSTLPIALQQKLQQPIEQLVMSDAARKALKEGAQVPDFTLSDALGNEVTLSHLLRQGPVVIAFYRGSWCPYCNLQLRAY